MSVNIRPATTADIKTIRHIIDVNKASRRMLEKETVTLYESVQEFVVAELADQVVGCGALHVLWEDLAEVRTVGVEDNMRGKGVGHKILEELIDRARKIGVKRIFCLTFETEFFGRHGFKEIEGTPVSHEVYNELLRSYDSGIAEFLDLEKMKPNTLGNTRMLLTL
jgi:amino-acid N-acetyltransferase